MKIIIKIIAFLSIIAVYIIAKELLTLYAMFDSIHPLLGEFILILLIVAIIYFIAIPIYKFIRLPQFEGPVKNHNDEFKLIYKRLNSFLYNGYLKQIHYDFRNISWDKDGYDKIILELKIKTEEIRNKYLTQIFISTSLSQNGFLDAIFILSASINMVKDIFILYNGRVTNKDLVNIAKKIYFAVAIGGSEVVELASEELLAKLSSGIVKKIPFVNIITGSIADGFVNAFFLARISYITENYCSLTHIKSDEELKPDTKFVINSVWKHIKSLVQIKGSKKDYKYCKYCGDRTYIDKDNCPSCNHLEFV